MNFSIPNKLVLAPIAGYSDVGLRTLAYKYGAGLCYTEMVSAKGLYYKNQGTKALLYLGEEEYSKTGVQLFGEDAKIISEVAKYDELSPFPFIDINMGCPVPKVVKNGEGSALVRDPKKVFKIISELKKSVGDEKIISAKIRIGFEKDDFSGLETAKAIQDGGADLIYVHGRTREEYFAGDIHFDKIAEIKNSLSIPVYGNGNVVDKSSYEKMLSTGVDGVMIGRGALGNPQIFSTIRGVFPQVNVKNDIKFHISKLLEILPENVVANNMKSTLSLYVKGQRDVKELRRRIFSTKTIDEIYAIVEDIQ